MSVFAMADGDEDFTQAAGLIDSKVSCDDLSEDQLEMIGDYYMEQLHPGVAHEYMDAMMGGEGSESLKQVHLSMARRFYCGESQGYGMMGGYSSGMMYRGGMMGGANWAYSGYRWWHGLSYVLYILLLIGLVVLVWLWIMVLLKNKGRKTKKR
ncbi:hypothetical protein COV20_05640 [Candidatus Woesearchaeota archaeon CG10_big_fil_rev_8_21_14_0_10_45_16]|nr:MAG: hypothetical protein COV20_05640 [Candidatus Woesearchaeota archaeon CG10_big_fil_rev_8_21_14_0_10_45_16]